jgi:imidazole glycerol-phosphate synthase subunit HisH
MIAIIDYGMGNVGSVLNMCKRIGASAVLTRDAKTVEVASHLILPGVGAFGEGMRRLRDTGLVNVLNRRVREEGIPVLGICLGMQLMTHGSAESLGEGLGWLDAQTIPFQFSKQALKVPHMGWNVARAKETALLFRGLSSDARFYFVHSYHLECGDTADIAATTSYGYEFTSSIQRNNVFGVQFHPEKSHRFGMSLLANFASQKQFHTASLHVTTESHP